MSDSQGYIESGVAQILSGHTSDVNSCDFSNTKLLVTGSNDKTVRFWRLDPDSDKYIESRHSPPLSPFTGHRYGVNCVRFSPFSTIIASCSTDGNIILWNAQTGQQVVRMAHQSECAVRVCSFSPSSAVFATGGDDETICLWDISTRTLMRSLSGHEAMITALAFTPDSNYILTGSTAGDIKLWDARHGHGKCLFTLAEAHDLGMNAADCSSQYQVNSATGFLESFYLLASCGNDDTVKLWHVRCGMSHQIALSHVLEGHTGNVNSCRFSPDGSLLASAAGDKTVIIWDPVTGKLLHKLEGHSRYVTSCCFSADNSLLATGSNDKQVIVWKLEKLGDVVIRRSSQAFLGIRSVSTDSGDLLMPCIQNAVSSWSVDAVATWISDSLNLNEYSELFRQNAIDGQELLHLTHDTLLTSIKIGPLGHRNKILRAVQALRNPLWQHAAAQQDETATMPDELMCPITHEFMREPVVAADGYTYERQAIQEWLTNGNMSSPMTNEELPNTDLIPNLTLSLLIKKYMQP